MEKKGGQNNVYLETERRWKEGNKHGHGNEKKKGQKNMQKENSFFQNKNYKKNKKNARATCHLGLKTTNN